MPFTYECYCVQAGANSPAVCAQTDLTGGAMDQGGEQWEWAVQDVRIGTEEDRPGTDLGQTRDVQLFSIPE